LLIAFGLTAGGSSTLHIYTQTVHRRTQSLRDIGRVVKREIGRPYGTYGKEEETIKECGWKTWRYHLKNAGEEKMILLKWILKK
jgi:hypothetical protein